MSESGSYLIGSKNSKVVSMVEYSQQRGNSKRRSKRGHREPVPWLLLCQKWREAPQGLILDGRISNTD